MSIPEVVALPTTVTFPTTPAANVGAPEWAPAPGPLMTRWAQDVSPENVLPEYPRPQMVRPRWHSLNGLWEYSIAPRGVEGMPEPRGKIMVPFPIESALSGVGEMLEDECCLWYRRTFSVPYAWRGGRLLLHFGAVDWDATVYVNGRLVGTHRGGYDGFTFDITDALKPGKRQEVVVAVWDPTDAGSQPRGKQIRKPEGIWYTPTTGIWQTVWLEPVPTTSLADVKIVPDVDSGTVRITATAAGDSEGCWLVAAVGTRRGGAEFSNGSATVTLAVPNPQLWSPDSPHLYDLGLRLTRDGKTLDRVKSYFGMRKIALGQDEGGVTRLFLNNKPLFMMGLLDQGYWPDGLYTAPTDAALRYDLEVTKEFGFNMVRKHAKIEPDRWYYWCDRLGLVVWQDMPSGGSEHLGPHAEEDTERTPESAAQFEAELKAMIDGRGNHPSVVMWVPFNEGWGQFDTARIAAWTEKYDPTRLVNSVSGWTDREVGDVHDIHVYPGPAVPPLTARRAAVLGEYGGLGLKVSGELWQEKDNWSYRGYATSKKLSVAYGKLQKDLLSLIGDRGLAAAVYTQTTDVEVEINGLLTYDRSVIKIDPQVVIETNQKLLASSRDPVLPRPVVTPPARRRRSVRVPQPLAEESLPQGDAVPEPALLASAFE